MSRTVCFWCKASLVLKDDILVCSNTDCPACDEKYLHEELIRTRKALEIAVDALKRLEKELYFNNAKQTGHIADSVMSIPSVALEQIIALEQKE